MRFKTFLLNEARKFDLIQELIIRSWGQLLYISYPDLRRGKDMTGDSRFIDLAKDFLNAKNKDEIENLNDWIADGAPMKNGEHLITKETVDAVLNSAQRPLERELKLYRYSNDSKLKPDSWISMTTNPNDAYMGAKHEFVLPKGTPVIDTAGLADKDEFIVSTDILRKI